MCEHMGEMRTQFNQRWHGIIVEIKSESRATLTHNFFWLDKIRYHFKATGWKQPEIVLISFESEQTLFHFFSPSNGESGSGPIIDICLFGK